jgi:hypothetical protein
LYAVVNKESRVRFAAEDAESEEQILRRAWLSKFLVSEKLNNAEGASGVRVCYDIQVSVACKGHSEELL